MVEGRTGRHSERASRFGAAVVDLERDSPAAAGTGPRASRGGVAAVAPPHGQARALRFARPGGAEAPPLHVTSPGGTEVPLLLFASLALAGLKPRHYT